MAHHVDQATSAVAVRRTGAPIPGTSLARWMRTSLSIPANSEPGLS
jgi:hypothetical protein